MTVDEWLAWAVASAEGRQLPQLKPVLEMVARSLRALRNADFNDRADGQQSRHPDH